MDQILLQLDNYSKLDY